MADYTPVAEERARFYRRLALTLLIGIAVAVILGLAGATGLGLFTPDEAFFTLAGVVAITTFVIFVFLWRMISVFDAMDKMRSQAIDQARTDEASRSKVIRELEALRDAVHGDLESARKEREKQSWNLQETVRKEVEAAQRAFAAELKSGMERDLAAMKAALERSTKDTEARLRNAETSLERATQAAAERARMDLAAAQKKDVVVMQKEAEVTNQIRELQEATKGLAAGLKSVEKRVAEAMDALERREMETAADRAKAERELADVRKRGELLIIKNRELENAVAMAEAPEPIRLDEKDLKDHVLMIEGIGPKYAALLNAAGIISIHQLVRADADAVADKVDAMPELVRDWQAMARLIPVRGVGPQYAELLVKSGVKSVEELGTSDSHKLHAACQKSLEGRKVKIVAGAINEGTVNRWIQAARARDYA